FNTGTHFGHGEIEGGATAEVSGDHGRVDVGGGELDELGRRDAAELARVGVADWLAHVPQEGHSVGGGEIGQFVGGAAGWTPALVVRPELAEAGSAAGKRGFSQRPPARKRKVQRGEGGQAASGGAGAVKEI